MAKAAKKSTSKSSGNDTVDKLAKAAMSKEMLAAGLAAAAAAISASPAARRKIRDAGLDAADTASQAATKCCIERDQAWLTHCRGGGRSGSARDVGEVVVRG